MPVERVKGLFVKDRSFYRLVVHMAIPVVLQNMITIGLNIIDTLMLGSYGEIQIAGSSLANEVINIFHILCMGMGGGAAVLTGMYWGRQDLPSLKKVVTIMLRLCIGIAMVFTLATIFAPETLMRFYTNDEATIAKGVLYLRYSIPAYLLMGVSLTLTLVMRSTRQVKLPLYTAIVVFFANVFFNYVLIFGKFGFPEMQIAGAALATTICRAIETAIIGGYFLFADRKVGYRILDFLRPCGGMVKTYISYSIPVFVSDSLLAFGNTMVAMIMGRLGPNFVAANAIIAMTVRLSTVFNQGVSQASSVITGNTLGAGEIDKAYHQGVTFFMLSILIGIGAAVIIGAVSPIILAVYGDNLVQETHDIAVQLMLAVMLMVVFQSTQGVLTKGVLRGGGDTHFLMMADVLFLWCASVPLGYAAAFWWGMSPFWIYVFLKIDWAIKTVWCTFRLMSKKWIRVVK